MSTLNIKDALILQDEEDLRILNGRTRRSIGDTYGRKSPTKFRRKLPGKRSWNNKENQYRRLNLQMDVKQQAAYEKAQEVMLKVNKKKQEKEIKKLARSNSKHPLHD